MIFKAHSVNPQISTSDKVQLDRLSAKVRAGIGTLAKPPKTGARIGAKLATGLRKINETVRVLYPHGFVPR